MKKLFTISLLLFIISIFSCDQKLSTEASICCDPSNVATASFATFASDPEFVAEHESPLALSREMEEGEMISFATGDGEEAKAYLVKAAGETKKYIFMIHEWWGLNDHIKKEAEKYATNLKDVHVLALDLYDGQLTSDPQEAGKIMQSVKAERAEAIISGALKYIGADASIATIGWCFGGGWSLQSSIIAGERSKACIIYYGMPEKDTERLKKLKAPVLGIFASQDKWINPGVVKEFVRNMKVAGNTLPELKIYNADHAFANPSNPKYQKVYADEAFELSRKFIQKNL
ncbi:MAG: dienelactone hydrolase family protein [Bacteroidota bacterium]